MPYEDLGEQLHQNWLVMGMSLSQVTLSQDGLLLIQMRSSLLHLNLGWQYITTLLLMMWSVRYYSPTDVENTMLQWS
jgi:hypothetical protein